MMTSHNLVIMSGEDVQGIRTGPLVAPLILLFLSSILTLVSLNSDWASMSAEMEYASDERDAAYNLGMNFQNYRWMSSLDLQT